MESPARNTQRILWKWKIYAYWLCLGLNLICFVYPWFKHPFPMSGVIWPIFGAFAYCEFNWCAIELCESKGFNLKHGLTTLFFLLLSVLFFMCLLDAWIGYRTFSDEFNLFIVRDLFCFSRLIQIFWTYSVLSLIKGGKHLFLGTGDSDDHMTEYRAESGDSDDHMTESKARAKAEPGDSGDHMIESKAESGTTELQKLSKNAF